MPMIVAEHLVFEYPGLRALDDVSFAIEERTITALVGPNGAGKTTLLHCIAALDTPLAGRVRIGDLDVHEQPREAHRRMGYLSDFFGLYDELTVRQCLLHRAAAQGAQADRRAGLVERAAGRMSIADRMDQKAGTLSRGLRQRLAIAQAIIHEPGVLLLDEPAAGLDPEARHSLASVLRGLRDGGMTIMVSSHILAELADYSTHMMILNQGRLVEHRAVGDGAASADRTSLTVTLAEPSLRLAAVLAEIAGISDAQVDGMSARFTLAGDARRHAEVLRALLAAGLPVAAFGAEHTTLQDAYLARMREETPA